MTELWFHPELNELMTIKIKFKATPEKKRETAIEEERKELHTKKKKILSEIERVGEITRD